MDSFTSFFKDEKTVVFDVDAKKAQSEIVETQKQLQSLMTTAQTVGKHVSKAIRDMFTSLSDSNQINVFVQMLSGGLEKCAETVTSFSREFAQLGQSVAQGIADVQRLTNEYNSLTQQLKQLDHSSDRYAPKGSQKRLEYEEKRLALIEQINQKEQEKNDANAKLSADYEAYAQMRDSGDVYSKEQIADTSTVDLFERMTQAVLEYRNAVVALTQTTTENTSGDQFRAMYNDMVEKLQKAVDLGNQYREIVGEKQFSNNEAQIAMPEQAGIQEFVQAQLKAYEEIEAKAREVAKAKAEAEEEAQAKAKALQEEREEADSEPEFENINELNARIAETKAEIESLQQKASSGVNIDVDGTIEELKTLQQDLKRLEDMKKTLSGNKPTPKALSGNSVAPQGKNIYENYDHSEQNSGYDRIKESVSQMASVFQSAQPYVTALGSALSGVGSKLKSVASSGFDALKNSASSVMSSISNLASRGFSALKDGVSNTFTALKKLTSGGFNALQSGVSMAKNGIQRLHSTMSGISKKATPNILKSFSSIKSMLMRRVKRTFIGAIFNQAKEGLQELAKYSSEFNSSMSSIKNASKETAGNLSVAMGNIVNAIAPVITTILNYVNRAIQAFNALFAMISGKSTMTVAKKSTDNYAKSLKNASGSAKDLNHQLYGFDELTRQDDNSGGGGGSKIGYEDQNIEDVIGGDLKRKFQEIIDAFNAGEFKKVGKIIGETLSDAIKKITGKLRELRSFCAKWARNIAEILNGIIDTDLFESIGELFGEGFNLIFDVVYNFLDAFDFKTLGKRFSDGINKLFATIDWDLVGKTFAKGVSGVWQTIGTLFKNLNWSGIGADFALGLGSFFENLDWDAWEQMVVEGINGITSMLYTFVDGVDWDTISAKFFAHVNGIVDGIHWDKLAGMVTEGINSILDVFSNFVDSNFFTNLATELGKTAGSILNGIHWETLSAKVSLGILQVRNAFWTFVKELDLPTLVSTKIVPAINGLMSSEQVKSAFATSTQTATDGINSIIEAFWNITKPASEGGLDIDGLAGEIGKQVGDLFGNIHWDMLATSVRMGLAKVVGAFSSFVTRVNFPRIAQKLADGINTFFDPSTEPNFGTIAKRASEGINEIIKAVKTLINPANGINFSSIRLSLVAGIRTLLYDTDWDALLATIGEGVTRAVTEFFRLVSDVFEPKEGESLGDKLANGINGIFKKDGKVDEGMFQELGKSLGDAIKGLFENIGDFFDTVDWQAIGQSIGEAFVSIDWIGIGKSIIRLVFNGIMSAADLLGGFAIKIVDALFGINGSEVQEQTVEIAKQQANQEAQAFTDSFVDAMNGAKKNVDAKNAVADALAEYFNVSPESIKQYNNASMMGAIAEILGFDDSDALVDAINANGGTTEIAEAIAKTLNISIEEATTALGDYGVAQNLANSLGISFEEAMGIMEHASNDRADYIARTYGVDINEAIKMLGGNSVYAEELARTLGITVEEATAMLENEDTFNALGELFADGADSAKEKFMEGIYQNSESEETVRAYFESFGITASDALIASFVGATPAIMSSSRGLLEACTNAQTAQDVQYAFKLYGKAITDEFANAISGEGRENIDTALYLLGQGVSESVISAMNISELHDNLMGMVETTGLDLETLATALTVKTGTAMSDLTEEQRIALEAVASKLGIDVGEALGTTVPDALAEALKQGETTVQEESDKLGNIASQTEEKTNIGKKAGEVGSEAVTKTAEGMQEKQGEVEQAGQDVHDGITEKLEKMPEEQRKQAEDMMGFIIQAISEKNETVVGAIDAVAKEVVARAKEILSGDVGKEIGNTFINGIRDGMSFADLLPKIKYIGTYTTEWMQTYLNYKNGYSIGSNLLIGMINGVNAYWQTLVDSIAHICNVTRDTARQILGIASPSKVFMEIGEYVMEGMQIGLQEEGKNAIDSVADIASAIAEEGAETKINTDISVMANGLDVVADKMSRIAQIFSDIGDTIAEMGKLEIPTVATGQVIPYKTKIETSPQATTGVSLESHGLEDALYNAFTRAMGGSDNQMPIDITLMIDGRKLTEIVTKRQRQQARAKGV